MGLGSSRRARTARSPRTSRQAKARLPQSQMSETTPGSGGLGRWCDRPRSAKALLPPLLTTVPPRQATEYKSARSRGVAAIGVAGATPTSLQGLFVRDRSTTAKARAGARAFVEQLSRGLSSAGARGGGG